MKNLYVLVFLFPIFNSCTLDSIAKEPAESESKVQDENFEKEPESLFFILLKVTGEQTKKPRKVIRRLNEEMGFTSLKLTLLLFGETGIEEEQYILIRKFGDFEEAKGYTEKILEYPIAKGMEKMTVLSQENYKKFVMQKSS